MRPDFGEAHIQALGRERPHADLAQARCVDDITAAVIGQRDHRRSDRGVAALVDRGADLTHPKSEPRKECVEERRLPYARWAGEHRHAPAQYLSHTFETVTTLGAREVRRVSRALIRCE